jgi:hypothetical protein
LVTPADVMKNLPFLDLPWRVCFRWHLHPDQVTGDATYGTVASIVAIEDQAIRAYVPLSDVGKRPDFFGPEAFTYDSEQDVYTCQNGTVLRFRGNHYAARVRAYQAPASACTVCPLKASCTDSTKGRIFTRSFDEPYLDRVRGYHDKKCPVKCVNWGWCGPRRRRACGTVRKRIKRYPHFHRSVD